MIVILVFTEMNLKNANVNKFFIDGLSNFPKPRPHEGRGSGVLIFYRSHFIKIKTVDIEVKSAEALHVTVNNEFNLIVLCRPPSSDKRQF